MSHWVEVVIMALHMPCSTCAVMPGVKCRDQDGRERHVHRARERAASEALKQQKVQARAQGGDL